MKATTAVAALLLAEVSADGGSGGDGSSPSQSIILTHAILATIAFVAIFPIGGILTNIESLRGMVWFHVASQTFGALIYVAAFGLGVYIANESQQISQAHPIIGIILLGWLVSQPIFGWLHHRVYLKRENRNFWTYPHVWLGRAAVVLGIINGGLGLELAQMSKGSIIAYSVCAGVIGLVYLVFAIIGERKQIRGRSPEKPSRMSMT